jgi:hypothetical protein
MTKRLRTRENYLVRFRPRIARKADCRSGGAHRESPHLYEEEP